jgi:hypothetical protein
VKNSRAFFEADGKGKGSPDTSKLLGLLLFTFAPQAIHKFSKNFRFFPAGGKDTDDYFSAKSFLLLKIIKSTK